MSPTGEKATQSIYPTNVYWIFAVSQALHWEQTATFHNLSKLWGALEEGEQSSGENKSRGNDSLCSQLLQLWCLEELLAQRRTKWRSGCISRVQAACLRRPCGLHLGLICFPFLHSYRKSVIAVSPTAWVYSLRGEIMDCLSANASTMSAYSIFTCQLCILFLKTRVIFVFL